MPHKPYGLLCPIAHASEILEPRWTMPILAELWCGSTRFNDIRRGLGGISPGLLSKRLKHLEEAGLVERIEDKAAGTIDYIRTPKAVELEPALDALATWAQRNIEAELALSGTDVSSLMWIMRRRILTDELPQGRTVIRFNFSDPDIRYTTFWAVAQAGACAEICITDPNLEVDLYVETTVRVLAATMVGRTTSAREVARGSMFLSGAPRLARTMDRWIARSDYSDTDGLSEFQ